MKVQWLTRNVGARARPAHRKVAVLGATLLALMAVVGLVGTLSVGSIETDLHVMVADDGRVLSDLGALHQDVVRGQLAIEQAATASAEERSQLLDAYDTLLARAVPEWNSTSNDPSAEEVKTEPRVFDEWVVSTAAVRRQIAAGDGDVDLSGVRASFRSLIESFEADIVPLSETVKNTGADAVDRANLARRTLTGVALVGLAGGLLLCLSTYRSARDQHRVISERDAERTRQAHRARVESRITQAMDHARTDRDVLEAVERALRELVPDRPTELLLADSSRAHFEVGVRTHRPDSQPACGVPSPSECPAVARSQTLQFTDGEAFDACPHLHGRPDGPVAAVCVPVSISGTADGVLHSTGDDGTSVSDEARQVLEYLAARAGDRIGVLRAFSRSEAQAATDPLTGLANRRTFENQISPKIRRGDPIALAFGDLDHFKSLNDSHGHDAGDRALRLFARTFRDAVRPGDLIARWGGEEFVAAFPQTDSAGLVEILRLFQERLATAVANASVPPFTVSFGVADHLDADNIEGLVAAADHALLEAKRAGRNRIVVSVR